MADAGFRQGKVLTQYETFLGTSKEETARKYGVRGANFIAFKN